MVRNNSSFESQIGHSHKWSKRFSPAESVDAFQVVSRPSEVMPTANGVVPTTHTQNGYHRDDDYHDAAIEEKPRSSVVVTKRYDSTTNEQGKDEDEYIEKAQETTCTVLLKDEKHKDVLLNRLATLRRNKELCDVVLYAGEREIFAHKVVLAALSPSFFELFTSNSQQQQPNVAGVSIKSISNNNGNGNYCYVKNAHTGDGFIQTTTATSRDADSSPVAGQPQNGATTVCLTSSQSTPERLTYCEFNDVDYDCFEALINYAYTGSLEICNSKVADLYKVAYSLRVQSCIKTCAQYLAKGLNIQNCIGIRKCANRTNDALLGNQVDGFIQKSFAEVVQKSAEFKSLPCVQIEVVLSVEDRANLKDERRLGEKIVDWIQQQTAELPDHVEFRMESLTEKSYMLYLDDDLTLQDCCDMDDASSVGSCDLIQDYKKQNRRTSQPTAQYSKKSSTANATKNAHVLTSPGPKLSRFSSTESMNSLASDAEEVEWKMIAISKNSENYCIMLAILRRKLAAVSIHIKDSPQMKPSLNDRLLLLAKMQEPDSVPLTNMVCQRCSVGTVFLNGMLIVCGGYDRGECLKSVEQFDFATNRWTTLAPMLKERGRADACACNDNIYVVGGSDGTRDLSSCECYDSATGAWSKVASLSVARSNNSAVCVDGQVYCVGGWNGQVAVKTCDCYDPKENVWHSVTSLTVGRYQAGCCEWNGKLIAVGGSDNWNCLSSAEIYEPSSNAWKLLPSMTVPRRGCGAAVLNDKLYVAGGSDGCQSLSSTEILDLNDPNAAWRPGPPLNTPRGNVRLVTGNNNRIFAVGGFSGKSFLNSIEYLEEGASDWKTHISKPTSLQSWTDTIDEDPVGESQNETPEDGASENGELAS